jgi:hypothetical protein
MVRIFSSASALFVAMRLAAVPALVAPAAAKDDVEQLCVKDHGKSYQDLAIACYSDAGCKYVEKIGGEPLRDYDRESVPFALGREKIEGIVTSSAVIMKQIAGYGYKCKALSP